MGVVTDERDAISACPAGAVAGELDVARAPATSASGSKTSPHSKANQPLLKRSSQKTYYDLCADAARFGTWPNDLYRRGHVRNAVLESLGARPQFRHDGTTDFGSIRAANSWLAGRCWSSLGARLADCWMALVRGEDFVEGNCQFRNVTWVDGARVELAGERAQQADPLVM